MTSSCFLCTSHFHFLIGRFQVGFTRAKLISVSKFSRKKKSVGLIVLVSSPVSGAQQENKTLIIFKLLVFLNPRAECHSRSLGILFGKIREQWLPSRLCALFVIRGKFGLGAGGKKNNALCFRWGCFCFDWERPADRSSRASLQ